MEKEMPDKEYEVPEIKWLAEPEDQDYPAAASYLGLIYPDDRVTNLVSMLKNAPMTSFKAKDIFRASRLSLLGISNIHVEKDKEKIHKGKSIAPLLLVRDSTNGKVVIADGYHRLCAVYALSEDANIPCKIV
jgi:hypothetical protein